MKKRPRSNAWCRSARRGMALQGAVGDREAIPRRRLRKAGSHRVVSVRLRLQDQSNLTETDTMTMDRMALAELIEKGSYPDLVRAMLAYPRRRRHRHHRLHALAFAWQQQPLAIRPELVWGFFCQVI